MSREYISMASFRSPFIGHPFQGLGSDWPVRRQMYSTANFRAPYDNGQFDGLGVNPDGLGALSFDPSVLPEAFRRYVETGATMPAWRRDIASALNQVPWWAYGVISVGALGSAYLGYKRWKKSGKK